MTPQQALGQALADAWPKHIEGSGSYPPSGHDTQWDVCDPALPSDGLAAATLAALPEPWVLTRGIRAVLDVDGEVWDIDAAMAVGAQRERERLRVLVLDAQQAEWASSDAEPYSRTPCEWGHGWTAVLTLLSDPEPGS